MACTGPMLLNLDQCGGRRGLSKVWRMYSRNPRDGALKLLREHNSLDTAVRVASDRALRSAAAHDDDGADFWADVFWVLIEIEQAG